MSGRGKNRLLANIGARLASTPTEATIQAISGGPSERETADAAPRQAPVGSIKPSPYQPKGRPSSAALRDVRAAVDRAGTLDALMAAEGERVLIEVLGPKWRDTEAWQLIELAADIATTGIEAPLEVRRVAGALELLSGHRRLAAALLAGLAEVPVVDRGEMSDHEAAAIVFRRNRLRADFTVWQEAISLSRLQEERRSAGLGDSVRELARVMGYSHGRAGELLQMARAFPPSVLAEVAADVPADVVEQRVAQVSYRRLKDAMRIDDPAERLAVLGLAAGLSSRAPDVGERGGASLAATPREVHELAPRRGGGYVLTVTKAVDRMTEAEAAGLLSALEGEVKRLRAHLRKARQP